MQKISTGKFHSEPPFTSFDHLVGEREQRRWDFEAERLCCRKIDDQFEFGRLLDRKIRGIDTVEDLVDIGRRAPPQLDLVRAVAHQRARLRGRPEFAHHRQPLTHGKRYYSSAL